MTTHLELDRLAAERGLDPNHNVRYLQLSATLDRLPGARYLNLGCGRGIMETLLQRPRDMAVGLDPDPESLQDARALNAHQTWLRFEQGSLFTYGGQWDLVVMSEVLEHLEDEQGALQAVQRLLAPGGHLVLTVPNLDDFASVITRFFKPAPFKAPDHLREYTLRDAKSALRRAGFHVIHTEGIHFGFPKPQWVRRVLSEYSPIRRLLARLFPQWASSHLLIARAV